MKKRILSAILILIALFAAVAFMSGCNRTVVDLKYHFKYAQIAMPDGTVISGEVKSWTDFETGDEVQVTIGTVTYLTHYANVVMWG